MPENPIPTPAIVEREHFIDACELRCRAMTEAYERAVTKRAAESFSWERGDATLAAGLLRFRYEADQLNERMEGPAWVVVVGDESHREWSEEDAALRAFSALKLAMDAALEL